MEKKYDIGVLGVWSGCNYGSIMTYYALNRLIEGMGKSVLMIDKPILRQENDVERTETHSRRFANEHYHISPAYRIPDFKNYNDMCEGFLLGSDQLWNYGISRNFGKAFYLDFAEPQKRRIAYATSFGHEIDFAPPEERKIITKYMRDFNAISLREDDGVRLCNEVYGVEAQQVLDPVFMVDRKEVYDPLIQKSVHFKPENEEEPFICAYILDPTPEKREALLKLSEKMGGMKIICLLDGLFWLFEENKQKMNLDNCIENLQVEDWLYYLSRARYVVTDSCHGASFAMIFGREFTAITNKRRGFSRFKSLGNLFDCHERIITDVSKLMTEDSLLQPVDYEKINSIMQRERVRCRAWMEHALNCPIEEKVKPIELSYEKHLEPLSSDYERCKKVVSMLSQYGVKNIVAASGERYLPLLRCFEAEQTFRIHSCPDERSAGYFALGIAERTGETVAVCADTPAGDFAFAAKKAKQNHIPVIFITCDSPANRQLTEINTEFLGNLPLGSTPEEEEELRVKVCSAAALAKKNDGMPVHINIPIEILNEKVSEQDRLKISTHYRTVELVSSDDGDKAWRARAGRLKQMNRVLLVYSSKRPLKASEKLSLDTFCKNYNVTVITDSVLNYQGEYAINPEKLLQSFGSDEFNERLWADVVITIGIPENNSLTAMLKKQKKSLGHWIVENDSKVQNPYHCLMRIFDCSPKYFLDTMNRFADGGQNSGIYYHDWKTAESELKTHEEQGYSRSIAVKTVAEKLGAAFVTVSSNLVADLNCCQLSPATKVYGTGFDGGVVSGFMGICAFEGKNILLVDDMAFFKDMNGLWNKPLNGNLRIVLFNSFGLNKNSFSGVFSFHAASAEGWAKSLGFEYVSAHNREELASAADIAASDENKPVFIEIFAN